VTQTRVQAPLNEGAGYYIPPRDPAHAEPDWFQTGKDELINDPDTEPVEILPTERHRRVP
jgi:hypothetical protein